MFLFRQFIVRQLTREPLRSSATVFGIALGVAVVIAIRLANASSLAGFETALDVMSGRTSLEIVGSGLGIDEVRLRDLGWLREFGTASPVIEGDALAVTPGDAPDEMVRILGVDILRDQPLRDYSVLEFAAGPAKAGHYDDRGAGPAKAGHYDGGAGPAKAGHYDDSGAAGPAKAGHDGDRRRAEASASADTQRALTTEGFLQLLIDPHSIVLTEKFARRNGLRVNDSLRLLIGDREQAFTITGLLKDEGPARVLDGNFVLMDIAAAQWALDRLGRVDRVDLRLRDDVAIDDAERTIAGRLPSGLEVQRPSRRGRQVENMLSAFHLNLTALSYISLLVGLFLVYNTVSTSVIVRREEIGSLRALGTSRWTILALFLAEGLALAIPGCALGIGLGQVLANGVLALTRTTVSTLYIATAAAAPALSWRDVATGFLIGLPLSLLAALLPAAEASRVTPMSAIRGADRLDTRYRLRAWRLVVPLVLFGAAAWFATRDPVRGLPLGGYAGALALVFGAAFLVPAVLFVLGRFGRRAMAGAFRVEGWLANANLAGAIPRLSISVGALAVALSMTVAIAVMIGSFRETVVYWVGQTLRADLFVGPAVRNSGTRQATISPIVTQAVEANPQVLAVDRFRSTSVPYRDAQVYLNTGDFAVMLAHGNLLFKAPRDGRAAMRDAIGRDAVVVSEAFALRYRHRVGDTIRLTTPDGPRDFRIAAIYYDYASDRGAVVLDRGTFAKHFGDLNPTGLTVYLREGADPDRVRSDLLASIGDRARLFIYTNRSLRQEILRIFDSTFAVTYALEAIAIIVAILGVSATLVTLILERRKELALLRLVGADQAQVRKMVVIEAAMMGGVSQAIGLGVGILLSLILIFVVNVQSFGWTIQFHVPVLFLVQMSALILLTTALAGLYPARLAARLHVASEITEE